MKKIANLFKVLVVLTLSITPGILKAGAAPLTFTTAQSISLTSPTTTFVIATGSLADALTVNATSVLVTMSSSTGGAFILTSISSDIAISASASGGSSPTSCINSIASTTILQSTGSAVYTITPTGSVCLPVPNSPVSHPTVGVGAGYNVGLPQGYILNPTNTNPMVATSSMLGLRTQSSGLQTRGSTNKSTGIFNFLRNLGLWSFGIDVRNLQLSLITERTGPAARVLAHHGVSRIFGPLTYRALKEYQNAMHLPVTGYLGPLTRSYINSHVSK